MANPKRSDFLLTCPTHGLTPHCPSERKCKRKNGPGYYSYAPVAGVSCYKCMADRAAVRRNLNKAILVKEHGGKCVYCGYNKCLAALDFHHLDPTLKSGHVRNFYALASARKEAAKCELVCSNCHRELHFGTHLTKP